MPSNVVEATCHVYAEALGHCLVALEAVGSGVASPRRARLALQSHLKDLLGRASAWASPTPPRVLAVWVSPTAGSGVITGKAASLAWPRFAEPAARRLGVCPGGATVVWVRPGIAFREAAWGDAALRTLWAHTVARTFAHEACHVMHFLVTRPSAGTAREQWEEGHARNADGPAVEKGDLTSEDHRHALYMTSLTEVLAHAAEAGIHAAVTRNPVRSLGAQVADAAVNPPAFEFAKVVEQLAARGDDTSWLRRRFLKTAWQAYASTLPMLPPQAPQA